MKSMVPANIVSGFKKCGVHPFNHDAIAIHTPNVTSENGATGEPTSGDSEEVLSGMELDKRDSERECVLNFTPEEESRFEMRYEEGYDLYDTRYLMWLRHHHPESVHTLDNKVPSIVDAFARHVPPSHPHEPVCDNFTSTTQSQSLQIASSDKPVNTSTVLGSSLPSSSVTPSSDIHLPTSSMTLSPGSSLPPLSVMSSVGNILPSSSIPLLAASFPPPR